MRAWECVFRASGNVCMRVGMRVCVWGCMRMGVPLVESVCLHQSGIHFFCAQVFILSFFHSFILSFFRSFVLSFFRSCILSFLHSFIRSVGRSVGWSVSKVQHPALHGQVQASTVHHPLPPAGSVPPQVSVAVSVAVSALVSSCMCNTFAASEGSRYRYMCT